MAEHHMSAREAWGIVRDVAYGNGSAIERSDARYARACAIVEACVKEHEAMQAHFDAPRGQGMKTWIAAQDAMDRTCALERGDAAQAAKEGR